MNISRLASILLFIFILVGCQNNPYHQGQRIYDELCSNCHMDDGSGLGKIIPDLRDNIKNKNVGAQVCLILHGINADSLGTSDKAMPGYDKIKPVNLTNLINFINFEWNHDEFKELNIKEIDYFIDSCK